MYQCVIFDMDGTLVNSYPGILHAYQEAFDKVGIPFPGEDFVRKAIGAPLPWVFSHLCYMPERQVEKAVESYRRYYHLHGQMEAFVYPGIPMALEKLREAGCILAVATLKKEGFAQEMLKRMNLYPYFDMVFGTDSRDQYTKAQLLSRCLVQGRVSSGKAVLVGDSPFDGDGAREAGIDFVGVLYGFGFQTQRQALQAGAKAAAVSPPQLPHLILAGKDGERP